MPDTALVYHATTVKYPIEMMMWVCYAFKIVYLATCMCFEAMDFHIIVQVNARQFQSTCLALFIVTIYILSHLSHTSKRLLGYT